MIGLGITIAAGLLLALAGGGGGGGESEEPAPPPPPPPPPPQDGEEPAPPPPPPPPPPQDGEEPPPVWPADSWQPSCQFWRVKTKFDWGSLHVRNVPFQSGASLALLPNGTDLAIARAVAGEVIEGVGTWYYSPLYGGWLAGRFLECSE